MSDARQRGKSSMILVPAAAKQPATPERLAEIYRRASKEHHIELAAAQSQALMATNRVVEREGDRLKLKMDALQVEVRGRGGSVKIKSQGWIIK